MKQVVTMKDLTLGRGKFNLRGIISTKCVESREPQYNVTYLIFNLWALSLLRKIFVKIICYISLYRLFEHQDVASFDHRVMI